MVLQAKRYYNIYENHFKSMRQASSRKRKDIPTDTAYRIRIAIAATGLKTPEFSRRSGISRSTLYQWENSTSPLTLKAATRISATLSRFNVECAPHWLLTGEGNPPQLKKESQPSSSEFVKIKDSALSMLNEAKIFESLSPDHIVMGISDDSMAPIYENGDYVGAIKIPLSKVRKAYNQYCIVAVKGGGFLIRRFKVGNFKNKYKLYAFNQESRAKDLVLLNVEIESVAVIIWHRRNFDI